MLEGESVVEYNDQISLVEFVSSKNPAMAKTVETPSATTMNGDCSSMMQRTEARPHPRNSIPTKRSEAHATVDYCLQTGNGCREKGGTQKLSSLLMK
ncbi:MAG: hypothetical protein P1Q69_15640 [Candidatus Thorarchaeota archaeon]|nr:hypothetical protein [Candidatus Thorarchaeota archaeon]